jgi:transcriptional regulator with XRE-family HTH domain
VSTRLTSRFKALRSLAQSRKLAKPAYRHAMVDAEIRHGLADQIRAMRERAGWSQTDLARKIGTSQPNVARMEATRDKYMSFPSLLSVAKAFDVGLLVRFVPFSEIVRRSFDASDFEQAPLSYTEEVTFTAQHLVSAPRPTATFAPLPPLVKVTQQVAQLRSATPEPYVDVA